MKTLFISDVHLRNAHDERAKALIDFLDREQGIHHLVIVGDLFDFWVGMQKVIFYEYLPILACLLDLRKRGVKISYIEGNHDFCLGPFFPEFLGIDVYEREMVFDLEGLRVLALHGDLIDRSDLTYRCFRGFLRSWFVRWALNFLPSAWLWKIGEWASRTSRKYSGRTECRLERSASLLRDFAQQKFGEGFDVVVTGHIHYPQVLRSEMGGKAKWYLNCGDWLTHFSYIQFSEGIFTLHSPAELSGN